MPDFVTASVRDMPKVELVALDASGLGPIDGASIEFGPGFNVLTGETGAGKTLLVGALSLCLGSSDTRGSRGDASLRVASVFRTSSGEVSLRREQVAGGRLRSFVNGGSVSSEELRTLAQDLLVIHGQHDSLRLRQRAELVRLIDEHGDVDDTPLRDVRTRIADLEHQRDTWGVDPGKWEQELEFRRFQVAEIDRVAPTDSDELDATLQRLEEVSSALHHLGALSAAVEILDGDSETAVLSLMTRVVHDIPVEGKFGDFRDRLTSVVLDAREVVRELADETSRIEADPDELGRLNERVSQLQALARKHGGSLAAVLEARERLVQEIADAEAMADTVVTLDESLRELRMEENRLAEIVKKARRVSANSLQDAVIAQFTRVALPGAHLEIVVEGDDGSDVEFLFSPSPGRTGGPLRTIASGGELSRILLALSLVSVPDDVVAVFDEIDAGVGGTVAQQIGECLQELARTQQVIVVTHLASIAAKADRHFVVKKAVRDGVAATDVAEVRGESRVSEIARMLAGDSASAESRALAARLLSGG